MKMVFLQNVKGVGRVGDIKEISDGYARNFLLPRKLARVATQDAIKQSETLRNSRDANDAKSKNEASALSEKLSDISITVSETSNEEGHLYGSIDEKRIIKELKDQHHISLKPDDIILKHHIKTIGVHVVDIDLFSGILAHLKVTVAKQV